MKAELTSGEIVTLSKECGCITHHEPHWVHMWRMERDMTLKRIDEYLGRMQAIEERAVDGKFSSTADYYDYQQIKLALNAASGEMSGIYGRAAGELKQRGITRLIDEESDKLTDLDRQRIRERVESLYPTKPEKSITPYVNEETEVRQKAKELI
jgi:hypothetical protein